MNLWNGKSKRVVTMRKLFTSTRVASICSWPEHVDEHVFVGQRAVRVVDARKGPNFTCIIATFNMRGIIHCEFQAGGTCMDHFNNFLTRPAKLAENVAATFVLDKAPCHHRARNVDIGNNGVRFLPAYRSMLNIAENAWSAWKAAFKRQLAEFRLQLLADRYDRRLAMLMQLGEQNLNAITVPKITEWYRKTTTYFDRCLQLLDIP